MVVAAPTSRVYKFREKMIDDCNVQSMLIRWSDTLLQTSKQKRTPLLLLRFVWIYISVHTLAPPIPFRVPNRMESVTERPLISRTDTVVVNCHVVGSRDIPSGKINVKLNKTINLRRSGL